MAAPDVKTDSPEELDQSHASGAAGLARQLELLPDGHPSKPPVSKPPVRGVAQHRKHRPLGPPDSLGNGVAAADRIRPFTDAEHEVHAADVRARLADARSRGLMTNRRYTIDPYQQFWTSEREALHDELVGYFSAGARNVPCEFRAVLAGGLAGAGKTTILTQYAGIDLDRHVVINPDAIKYELARRGKVPPVPGLTPMEATELVHEESSHIARRLAMRVQADGRNVIWDITMSSGARTGGRIDNLRTARYTRIEGIFVDVPIEVSLQRIDSRHRAGHDEYRAGRGLGGRLVPAGKVLAQRDDVWGSRNRWIFEQLKPQFDTWSRYDNSIDGRPPFLAEAWRPGRADADGRF